MYGASANNSIGNSESSIGNSGPAAVGPVNARARWFNPYPFDKYAIAGG